MTKEEKIEEIRQRARKNFSLGYNCAECVTEAVLLWWIRDCLRQSRKSQPGSAAA